MQPVNNKCLYDEVCYYQKKWDSNIRNHKWENNCTLLAEIAKNPKVNVVVIQYFLNRNITQSNAAVLNAKVVDEAFQRRFHGSAESVRREDPFLAQNAATLMMKVFALHSDKSSSQWINLQQVERLKGLSAIPGLKEVRPEVLVGHPSKPFTSNLHIGLHDEIVKDKQKAEDLAARLGGVAKEHHGKYYIQLNLYKALDIAQRVNVPAARPVKVVGPAAQPVSPAAVPPKVHVGKPHAKSSLDQVAKDVESKHKYKGYGVNFAPSSSAPIGMTTSAVGTIPQIGRVGVCHAWQSAPSINAPVPSNVKGAAVRLPKGVDAKKYAEMRKLVQQGVIKQNGISPEQAKACALALGGMVIEATLPYNAGGLLGDNGASVDVHCIFQSGLNFAGYGGGGIPVDPNMDAKVRGSYIGKNAASAVESARNNKSDVLVYNIGIGAGFFAGDKKVQVLQDNVNAICASFQIAKKQGSTMACIVPHMPDFTAAQIKQLQQAGIQIVDGDKGAVAALAARQGLKVSETFAADPMSMLGIHGPGLWWESAGSASDEERAAFLTPCYALGYMPINVYAEGQKPTKIAAISEFML